jgi:hypothetical protein
MGETELMKDIVQHMGAVMGHLIPCRRDAPMLVKSGSNTESNPLYFLKVITRLSATPSSISRRYLNLSTLSSSYRNGIKK